MVQKGNLKNYHLFYDNFLKENRHIQGVNLFLIEIIQYTFPT